MKLFIRSAEPQELPRILQLQALSLRILSSTTLTTEAVEAYINHQRQQREQSDESIVVAICNEEIIGFLSLLKAKAQISGLYVHPDFVRQGIGSELLYCAEEIMQEERRRSLFVLSSEYAREFYKKRGFRLLSNTKLPVDRKTRVRVFWMQKTILERTEAEKQKLNIAVAIVIILTVISLWAAIA